MFSKEKFSVRLAELRAERKTSAQSLAETVGITKSAISRFEHGKDNPNCNTLCALADYFDVSLDYLVGRSDIAERR